jgi:hypothetical protein
MQTEILTETGGSTGEEIPPPKTSILIGRVSMIAPPMMSINT